MAPQPIARRRFLGAAGAAGLSVAGLSALTACGGGTASNKGGAVKSETFKLPDYKEASVAKADLTFAGVDPTYLKYPKDLVKSVASAPGDGKPITFFGATWTTPMPPLGDNKYWQELNRRLGSQLKMNIVDDNVENGHLTKFSAMVASGDIPELVWFPPNGGAIAKLPELLKAKFYDLAPYLSGSAVLEYPNLANLAESAWRTSVFDGRLVGTTLPYGLYGQVLVVNRDYWEPVGGAEFDSAQDFLDKGKELLDTKRKKYVLEPAYVNLLNRFAEWLGAPNGWRAENDRLTHMYESDEYAEALEFAVKVFKAGLFWPDANITTAQQKVEGGSLGAYVNSYPGYRSQLSTVKYPVDIVVPFAFRQGVKSRMNLGNSSLGWCSINKDVPKARVKTLLRVMDYLNAPMGTTERKFLEFGLDGTHYKSNKDGDPILTSAGEAQVLPTIQPVHGIGIGPEYNYAPGYPQRAERAFRRQQKLSTMLAGNAASGYYSDTNSAKGGQLTAKMQDTLKDIITGRKKLSQFKSAVQKWQNDGGNSMREEYQDARARIKLT